MGNCGHGLFWATYNSITEAAHHQEKSIFICRLTSIVLYHILSTVIRLQVLARRAIGGVSAGTPFLFMAECFLVHK